MFLYGKTQSETTDFYTQQQLKAMHLRQIFNLVLEHGSVSRGFISRNVKLSPTAVSSLVDELLYTGVLVTSGRGVSMRAGRRPVMLEMNRGWKQIVTLKINPDVVKYALFDMSGAMIESAAVAVQGSGYIQAVQGALDTSNALRKDDIGAVCLAVPAIADAHSQRLLLNVLDMDDDQEFLAQIDALFPGAELLVGNDSAAYAYAEKEFGSEAGADNLIYINYTHGIGAGIIVDGTIFNGDKYRTGEIGHMTVDMNGPQCICGNRGCLERVASVPAIIRSARQAIEDGGYSVLTKMARDDPSRIDLDMMIEAYRSGDRLVEQVIDDMAEKLSFGIRNLLCLFHPGEIVIGGSAHRFGDRFLKLLKDHSRGTFYWDRIYETQIRYTRVEEYGANLGMAKYYLDQVLSFGGDWAVQMSARTLN